MTGDFNSTPDSRPYEVLTNTLLDGRVVAEHDNNVTGPRGTFHGFDGNLNQRIDYVFVTPSTDVTAYRTLKPQDWGYRSDHVPVVADLKLVSQSARP